MAPGFYYWDDSLWVPLSSQASGSQGWLLKGNSGTNPDSDFVGTMDSLPLVFRVNNQIAFKFNTNGSIQRDGGGHVRRAYPVDLLASRDSAEMVASVDYSAILCGQNNIVTGLWSGIVVGVGSIVYPKNSFSGGGGGHLIDSLGGLERDCRRHGEYHQRQMVCNLERGWQQSFPGVHHPSRWLSK